jgi:Zn-dependent protease with chaperone function
MRGRYWGWKREAEFGLTRRELEGRLPNSEDEDALTDSASFGFGLFDAWFEWEIRPGSDTYQLVERCYISRLWYWLVSLSIIGVTGGSIGFGQPRPVVAVVSFVVVILSLFLLNGLLIAVLHLKSPVTGLYRIGENKTEFMPMASLFLGFFPPLLILLMAQGLVQLAAFIGIFVWLVLYHVYHLKIAERSFHWQSRLVRRTRQLPLIASNYVVMLGLSGLVLSIFWFTYRGPLFVDLMPYFPSLFPFVLSLVQFGVFAMSLLNLREGWRLETTRFRRHGRNIKQTRSIVVTAGVVIGASAGFVFLSYHVLRGGVWLVQTYGSIGVYCFVFVTAFPICFFGTGFCYQIVSVLRNLFAMFRKAEQRDLGDVLDVDAETYVLEYEGVFAGAVSLFDDYILVSEGVLDELDDNEIAAVLAHEEGHIKRDEARITLLIAFFSPLVFTGKNILYGILDFRAREYRADEYAVSRLGNRQQVFDALDSLQEVKTASLEDQFGGVTPTLIPLDTRNDDPSVLTRIFGFYFGNFAFSQAHPDLEERKEELRS